MIMRNDDLQLLHIFIHDLKAPLSSTKSFIDLVSVTGELNQEQKHYAHRAQTSLARANKIIALLLDYARIEANEMPLELEVCDLQEVFEQVRDELEGDAQERAISFKTQIHPDAQFVQAELYLLHSVIQNLVSNAIKYNRTGGEIRISTDTVGEYVRIRLSDTGLGIPPESLERVFDKFYRVETKEHQQIKGTGIGLAMVRTIIERHHGEITVESEVGKGSTFIFALPYANISSPDYDREPLDGLPDEYQEENDDRDDRDSGEAPR